MQQLDLGTAKPVTTPGSKDEERRAEAMEALQEDEEESDEQGMFSLDVQRDEWQSQKVTEKDVD